MRISYDEMLNEFTRVLVKYGMDRERAGESAKIFTDNSLDGVYSHGVNRFSRTVSYIEKGYIKPLEVPSKIEGMGGFERWEGNLGMGNLNAKMAMDRAIELSREHGIGLVAMKNTNHWMRGGSYGWQAADKGCVGICWTNTMPNMPAWGGKDRRIGNNPFVISIPRKNGEHVVIDCAMAQFSYGKMESCKRDNKKLPVAGGYNRCGELTMDAVEILETGRVLPIGFWKGSGLSIALDLVATVLSGGKSTTDVGRINKNEYGVSQVFIAIDPTNFNTEEITEHLVNNVIDDIKESELVDDNVGVSYPGESSMKTRKKNLEEGIPVNEEIWQTIKNL